MVPRPNACHRCHSCHMMIICICMSNSHQKESWHVSSTRQHQKQISLNFQRASTLMWILDSHAASGCLIWACDIASILLQLFQWCFYKSKCGRLIVSCFNVSSAAYLDRHVSGSLKAKKASSGHRYWPMKGSGAGTCMFIDGFCIKLKLLKRIEIILK